MDKSITILYVLGDLDIGGAEQHIAQISPKLLREGIKPTIYCLTHKGYFAQKLEYHGVDVYEPPMASILSDLPKSIRILFGIPITITRLFFLLINLRPAIVHCFLPTPYLIGGLCSIVARIPIRIMSRRSLNVYQSKYLSLKYIEKCLHTHMTAILGNSKVVCQQLRDEEVPESNLGLLYNGIDTEKFCVNHNRDVFRKDLGFSETSIIIIIVANLIPYKGHVDMLLGLSEVIKQLPKEWNLLCVGRDDGIQYDLEKQAHELGIEKNIIFLGQRMDIPELLAASDIAVLCSHQEGFSNSILESMAAGLPMVVTDVGGNSEAVEDGVNGLVVPAHNPQKLGDAIATLANNKDMRKKMGVAGRCIVEEKFTLSKCVQQYTKLYKGLQNNNNQSVEHLLNSNS
jgi:glycosyltransferase involved in cell wall biosynthesis